MKKLNISLSIFALFMIAGYNFANAQRITVTIAGTGLAGFSGNGGSGKFAAINAPYDVCVDAAKNIYFTDFANGRVRKISAKEKREGVPERRVGG